jgi:hypothetical protein
MGDKVGLKLIHTIDKTKRKIYAHQTNYSIKITRRFYILDFVQGENIE